MKNMKVYVLFMGDTWTNSNYIVMSDTMATAKNPDARHRMLHCPSSAVLIYHPEVGWILYDTGVTDDLSALNGYEKTFEQAIIKKPKNSFMSYQLNLVGIEPKDVKYVINSHMHYDHIGNDRLFADTAEFFVARKEAEYAYQNVLQSTNTLDHGWYIKNDVLLPRKQVTYIDEDTELFKDVTVLKLPGHSPCVLGLMVHLGNETLIFTSDAVNETRNLEGQLPGSIYDSLGYVKSLEKLRRLQKKYNARMFFGHDTKQLTREVRLAPECYE